MESKLYRLYGINVAMELLRPNATWEISNNQITYWNDPRPCPTMDEVLFVMDEIKKFEDKIHTIWLPEQLETQKKKSDDFDKTFK